MIAPDEYQAVIATPIGMIGIRMAGEAVGELDFLPADAPERAPADVVTCPASVGIGVFLDMSE